MPSVSHVTAEYDLKWVASEVFLGNTLRIVPFIYTVLCKPPACFYYKAFLDEE